MIKKKDEILDSNYDGIQEYDNDLPRWWLALFYLTIVYAIIYTFYTHTGSERNSEQVLEADLKRIYAKQEEFRSKQANPVSLAEMVKDNTRLTAGKAVYMSKCAACHAAQGQGLVGPNLTDDYWIHGGALADIHKVIQNGVLEKGMLAWKGVLTEDEINNVTVYIRSLRGSNPENPKAAQGELYAGAE